MTTENPHRPYLLFEKFTEVRPPSLARRNEHFHLLKCAFEKIAETEEENVQISKRTPSKGRSPYGVYYPSPFQRRRHKSGSNADKRIVKPLPCRSLSEQDSRQRSLPALTPTISSKYRQKRHILTLPPIPEDVTTSP